MVALGLMFKVQNFVNFDTVGTCEAVTSVHLMNISIPFRCFLLPPWDFSYLLSLSPHPTQLLIYFLSLQSIFVSTILYKWNRTVCILLSGFFHFIIILRFIQVLECIDGSLPLFLSNIQLHRYTTVYSSIQLLLDMEIAFRFWLLQINLLWIFMHKTFKEVCFYFFWLNA